MKGNKVYVWSETYKKFLEVAGGDRKLADSIINQVLQGYVGWQERLIEVRKDEPVGVEEINN
ncbi:hypothetical protein KO465_01400 [Candidatus Micrarchaeota archaeon]|nr:hypothetical protein [Candidatus Micrarchaeota archaeon]